MLAAKRFVVLLGVDRMNPKCPNGHEFTLMNVLSSLPTPTLGIRVKAVYCKLCGHVYSVVRLAENE